MNIGQFVSSLPAAIFQRDMVQSGVFNKATTETFDNKSLKAVSTSCSIDTRANTTCAEEGVLEVEVSKAELHRTTWFDEETKEKLMNESAKKYNSLDEKSDVNDIEFSSHQSICAPVESVITFIDFYDDISELGEPDYLLSQECNGLQTGAKEAVYEPNQVPENIEFLIRSTAVEVQSCSSDVSSIQSTDSPMNTIYVWWDQIIEQRRISKQQALSKMSYHNNETTSQTLENEGHPSSSSVSHTRSDQQYQDAFVTVRLTV